MSTPVTFGIAVPQQVGPDGFDPAALQAYVRRAEDAGLASAWVAEQVIGTAPLLAPLEVLALVAGCTQRLRLGTAALISTVHSPLHLAASVATLDHLSGGRVELGVAGGGPRRPFAAYGLSAAGWAGRYAEGIELVLAAWQHREVRFDGRWFQVDGLAVEPKPVQRPHPPLWVGGSAPSALRRAVRLADGFIGAGSTTTAAFAAQVQVVRAALAERGRDPQTFRIAKRVYLAVDDDPQRARATVRARLADRYRWFGLPDLSPVAVAGTPGECAAGLQEVVDAGAALVVLDPMDGDPAHLERLITEVVPAVSS